MISSTSKTIIFFDIYSRPNHKIKHWNRNSSTIWDFLCYGLCLNGSNLVQYLLSFMPNKSNSSNSYNNDVPHLDSMLCQNLSIPASRYNGQCFFHICITWRTDTFGGSFIPHQQHMVCICFVHFLLCCNVHICLF